MALSVLEAGTAVPVAGSAAFDVLAGTTLGMLAAPSTCIPTRSRRPTGTPTSRTPSRS